MFTRQHGWKAGRTSQGHAKSGRYVHKASRMKVNTDRIVYDGHESPSKHIDSIIGKVEKETRGMKLEKQIESEARHEGT